MKYKSKKKYILSDALSKFANANNSNHNFSYLELNILYLYYIILVKIYLNLIFQILIG